MNGKQKTQVLVGEQASQSQLTSSPFGKTHVKVRGLRKRFTPEYSRFVSG